MIFEEYNEQKATRAAKEHAEKRFNEGVEQGIEQGKIKGAIEKQNSLIKRMFEKNMTAEEIADITCLPTEEVKKILKIYEQSLKETPYTPFIEVPYGVDMRELSNYLRQKCCSFDELSDAEKAKFVDGDLSEFRKYLKQHNLHNGF